MSGELVALAPNGPVVGGTLTLPTVTAGANSPLLVTTSVGTAALQSVVRRGAQSIPNPTAFAEVTITAIRPVTFVGAFTINLTYPGGPGQYFSAFQDHGGVDTFGPISLVMNSVYTATSPAGTYAMAAGQSVSFDFSIAPAPLPPTPTPAPTGGPTSGPTTGPTTAPTTIVGPLVLTPSSLSFTSTGAAAAQTSTVTESGYAGAFTVSSENPAVATVSISGSLITVTPTGPGTAFIDVRGGLPGRITVTVTITPVTIN